MNRQAPLATAAMNSQTGMPHKSTLRKPGLYTASIRTTARKTQIIFAPFIGVQST